MAHQYDKETGMVAVADTINSPAKKTKMARKDSTYFTSEELTLIKPFRAGFRNIRGQDYDARAQYLRNFVFPPLLTLWYRSKETRHRTNPENIDKWTDRIASYTTANWKSKIQLYKQPKLNITISDYFYNYRTEELLTAIKAIVQKEEGEEAQMTTQLILKYRHKATRAIMDGYSPQQQGEVAQAMEMVKTAGYTPDVQHHHWNKHGEARLRYAHRLQLIELGVASFQLSAVTDSDGNIHLHPSENLAEAYGYVGAPLFRDVFKSQVIDFAALIADYIKDIKAKVSAAVQPNIAPPTAPHAMSEENVNLSTEDGLVVTDLGFPLLPVPWPTQPQSAKVLEPYWKTFVLQHYSLASGAAAPFVPWTKINALGLQNYISPQYLPLTTCPDFKFADYRSMSNEHIQSFFRHVADRQQQFGPEEAFRFSHTYGGKKRPHNIAKYPQAPATELPSVAQDEGIEQQFANVPLGKRSKKKPRGRAGEKDTAPSLSADVEGSEPGAAVLPDIGPTPLVTSTTVLTHDEDVTRAAAPTAPGFLATGQEAAADINAVPVIEQSTNRNDSDTGTPFVVNRRSRRLRAKPDHAPLPSEGTTQAMVQIANIAAATPLTQRVQQMTPDALESTPIHKLKGTEDATTIKRERSIHTPIRESDILTPPPTKDNGMPRYRRK